MVKVVERVLTRLGLGFLWPFPVVVAEPEPEEAPQYESPSFVDVMGELYPGMTNFLQAWENREQVELEDDLCDCDFCRNYSFYPVRCSCSSGMLAVLDRGHGLDLSRGPSPMSTLYSGFDEKFPRSLRPFVYDPDPEIVIVTTNRMDEEKGDDGET